MFLNKVQSLRLEASFLVVCQNEFIQYLTILQYNKTGFIQESLEPIRLASGHITNHERFGDYCDLWFPQTAHQTIRKLFAC